VYTARNLRNGHHYVGATTGKLSNRKCEHLRLARQGVKTKFCGAAKRRDNVVFYRVYDIDGKELGRYCIGEFARLTGFYAENARKQIKKTGKYKQWKFVKEETQ